MKNFLKSLVVVLAMAAPVAAFAETTIYYDNSASGWDEVHIHYWSDPGTTWPGVALTKVDGDIWKYTFPSDPSSLDGFLFCNAGGTDQTSDCKSAPINNHLYKGSGGKGKVTDLGEYNTDPLNPSITASPISGTRFDEEITVTLSVTPDATMYYTTDGSTPTTASAVYSAPLTFTETTTLTVLAVVDESHSAIDAFKYSKRKAYTGDGKNLITDYYSVNPNGQVGSNRTVTMNFASQNSTTALNNWTADDLIAQGVARDVAQAFRGNHERPIVDSYALYAAYDDEYLYLGAQFVYTVWDIYGEGKQPRESKPYNMDGCMYWAFDLDPELEFDGRINGTGPIWNEGKQGAWFQNGVDAVWVGSTKPGVGTPGFFTPTPDGHASYDAAYCKTIPGSYYGYADGLLPSIDHVWGQEKLGYETDELFGNEGFVDLMDQIDASAHTFYEWRFPLSLLGITADYIRTYGIGVMYLDIYGTSPVGGTPYDPSYFDNVNEAYSMDPSSSGEKEDDDIITFAPARIGKLAGGSSVRDLNLAPANADTPAEYYNLQGIRVANPVAGQIYIRRTATTATTIRY